MKKIIFILLLIPVLSYSQKDSTIKKGTIGSVLYIDSATSFTVSARRWTEVNNVEIKFYVGDSTIEIYGDTTKAILMLFKKYNEMVEAFYAAESMLDFFNLDQFKKIFFKDSKYFSRSLKYYRDTKKKYNLR